MLGLSPYESHPMAGFLQVGFPKPLEAATQPGVIKQWFSDEIIAIRWCGWPVDNITRNLPAIVVADIAALKNALSCPMR
jgi:hypothetical protein